MFDRCRCKALQDRKGELHRFCPFQGIRTFFGTSLRDLVAHSLKSGLIDLTEEEVCDNMDLQGYACSEVDRGKEETE